MDIDFLIRSAVSLLVITSPYDAVKVLFFNNAIAGTGQGTKSAAVKVCFYILLVLGGTAIFGRQLLELLGVDMNAFRITGGLLIVIMGGEMLFGGGGSHAQGENVRKDGPEENDALFIPLTLPLIAGPGAIATTISIVAHPEAVQPVLSALIAVGIVALVAFLSFTWGSRAIQKIKPSIMASISRIGGLLLVTIGIQMGLVGLKQFFAG
ncbi:MAG: NAAT family transporter [Candidatus Pelagadaptatus aseana]|uniref:MarC family protein n=1 Tax=Candidatus Pelagadaptatus aseana TaxID=3120508 RepID=UPI0039B3546E